MVSPSDAEHQEREEPNVWHSLVVTPGPPPPTALDWNWPLGKEGDPSGRVAPLPTFTAGPDGQQSCWRLKPSQDQPRQLALNPGWVNFIQDTLQL